MGIQGCAEQVVIAMDGVDAPGGRHDTAALQRSIVEFISQCEPVSNTGAVVIVRWCATTTQNRSDLVLTNFGRGDVANVGLNHLADFLGQ